MQDNNNIQWFPGHMAKARRLLDENLKLVDIVVEMTDARIPFSSRNPDFDRLLGEKPRVLVCNKRDLADEAISAFWKPYYTAQGISVLYTDCRTGAGVRDVTKAILQCMQEKIRRKTERGMRGYTVRAMVVGIPNVGKSSFINRVAGKNVAATADKPGVTRGQQWIRMNGQIALLDMPGLLWPKFTDQRAAFCLAATGAIKDDILDRAEIASFLLLYILDRYPGLLGSQYGIPEADFRAAGGEAADFAADPASFSEARRQKIGATLLETCARKRGCLQKGGTVDTERVSAMILDDFRGGRLGRISLDPPLLATAAEAEEPEAAEAGKPEKGTVTEP